MAFVLTTYIASAENLQGIGIAVESAGAWYYIPYEIDIAADPMTWIVANLAQIQADALTDGTQIDPALVAGHLDDSGQDGNIIADGVEDIVDLFPTPAQRKVLWAIVRLMVNQFNVLRTEHGMFQISYVQAKQAIIDEYKLL